MKSERFYLRRAAGVDLDGLLKVEQSAFSRPWSRRLMEEELVCEFSRLWVIGNPGGPVIGFLCYRLIADEMDILRIGVLPHQRGKGIAPRLLTAGIDEAVTQKAVTAVLEVRPSNASALRLYEKFDFIPAGKRPGYFTDTGEAALILTKVLRKGHTRGIKEEIHEHENCD